MSNSKSSQQKKDELVNRRVSQLLELGGPTMSYGEIAAYTKQDWEVFLNKVRSHTSLPVKVEESEVKVEESDVKVEESDVKVEESEVKVERVVWSFPSKSRCPRCRGPRTMCRRTDSVLGRQYRVCLNAVCRRNYTVNGTKI